MNVLRSERVAAFLLLAAAILGLVLANSPIGHSLIELKHVHLAVPFTDVDLSLGHWVSDGLLAVFFFIVAVELRRELVVGELNSFSKAALPAIAAIGGVVAPALVFLAFAGGGPTADGWPIPTATDIAFALGVLAMFGRFIPTRVRVFLLALAVLDDLIAILLIAFFFTADADLAYIGFAAITVTVFGMMSRLLRPRSPYILARRPQWPIIAALCVLAVLTWSFVYLSGVHATIAGVMLGLVMSRRPAGRAVHGLEPWSNGVILPLFAFSAALVAIPQVRPSELDPAFWGILVGLPVGKLVGITLIGGLATLFVHRRTGVKPLTWSDIAVVALLGGIGFTVSLLMNELAFRAYPEVADQGVVAVLLGSAVAIVAGAIAVAMKSRSYRRQGEQEGVGGAMSR
ncbi:Na+/H+ antiporter NhaA [Agromyces marinus]|uniref:Na(+)/H(+) antiporter NhaA n=1 Tax=Agromyces marinus TaxID=1389020 RepID=A0ABN6YIV5_9MICO|nr:Na+/H+ antiporter NhaA [Agromyces marinus]UIP59158.1 Na(+)/H(+) antiporter NhaA [Agromyces marinus]BDZ55847.1 Na+/H+ antiporter [Agromyces marinus]